MARGPKSTTLQGGESRQMRLHLAQDVLKILDAEALAMHQDAARFFRMLIRRRMGLQRVERLADTAHHYPALAVEKPVKEPFVILLPAELHEFVQTSCYRLGGGAPSTFASDLILQWVGISPLDRDRTITIERELPTQKPAGRRRTGSQPTKVQLLSLATAVVELLQREANAMAIRHTELLRNLLRAKMGVAHFQRPVGAPPCEMLSSTEHTKQNYRVHLPLDHIALINRISAQLGGGEKSTIVAHLILDFVNLSPLRPQPTASKN